MTLKVAFIPAKRCLEDAARIESFAFFETEKIKVIEKGALPSAVSAKYSEEKVALKEILCKHWDEEGNKFIRGQNIAHIAFLILLELHMHKVDEVL